MDNNQISFVLNRCNETIEELTEIKRLCLSSDWVITSVGGQFVICNPRQGINNQDIGVAPNHVPRIWRKRNDAGKYIDKYKFTNSEGNEIQLGTVNAITYINEAILSLIETRDFLNAIQSDRN